MPEVIEQIKQEASSAESKTREEHGRAVRELRTSAVEAKEEVREEARGVSVKAYAAYEEPLEEVKEEIKFEKRRGYLPGYKPQLKPLRAKREALKAEREVPRAGVRVERQAAVSDIDRQVAEGEARLDASLATSLGEIEKWEKESIQTHEEWKVEVAAYEASVAKEDSWEAAHVKLDSGEWVEKKEYDKLPPEERARLKALGTKGYQAWAEGEKAKAEGEMAKFEKEKAEFERTHVYIRTTKEWVDRAELEAMSPKAQSLIKTFGTVGYNAWADKQIKDFEDTHVKIGDDRWVIKSEWDALTPAQQTEVRKTGKYTVIETVGEISPGVTVTASGYVVAGAPSPGVTVEAEGVIIDESKFDYLTRVLGREPTLGEMEAHARGEAPKYKGWWGAATGIPVIGGMIHQTRLGAELLFPGTQSPVERAFRETLPVVAEARKEWYTETFGGVPGVAGQVGYGFYPAIRVASPKVSFGEITGAEWGQTAISAAALAGPVWIPPTIRGIKAVPHIPAGVRARLGTYPFSEPPGLVRAPVMPRRLPQVAVKERIPRVFEDIYWPMERFSFTPRPTFPTYRPPHTIHTPGRPISTMTAEEASALYGRRLFGEPSFPSYRAPHTAYMPTKGISTMTAEESAALYGRQPLGGWSPVTTAAPSPMPVPTWTQMPSGRYMPVQAKPLYAPDFPFPTPLHTPWTAPAQKLAPSISPAQVTKAYTGVEAYTSIIQKRLSTLYPISRVRPQVSPTTRGLTIPQPFTRVAPQVAVKPIVQPQVLPQVLPQVTPSVTVVSQVATMTQLQTQLQIPSIVKVKVATMTQLQTQLQIPSIVKVKVATRTQRMMGVGIGAGPGIGKGPGKRIPRPKLPLPGAEGVEEKRGLKTYPAGTITWRQGFVRKYIEPPYEDVTPETVYEPKGSGVPSETLRIIGGPAPLSATVDLGVVDVYIEGDSEDIEFRGGGLRTDIGRRHPSKTRGMSVKKKAGFKRIRF